MPPEFPEEFGKLFERMAEYFNPKASESNDPADYPRSIPIKDARALTLLEELQVKNREMHNMMSRMDIAWHEHETFKAKVFVRLREAYPALEVYEGVKSGNRYFKYKGDWYYVGWGGGGEEKKPMDEKPEQVKGWLDTVKPEDFGAPKETSKPPEDPEAAPA